MERIVIFSQKTCGASLTIPSNPLAVDSLTSKGGSIINNPSQASGYGFWTFQRYWYRIEANDAVSEFHIDWDDGEDNSLKKANVSIIKTEKPSFFGITNQLDYIVEDNKLKHNKFIPGVKIPIFSKKKIKDKDSTILVLAWNFFEEIKKNNNSLGKKFINIKDLENNS